MKPSLPFLTYSKTSQLAVAGQFTAATILLQCTVSPAVNQHCRLKVQPGKRTFTFRTPATNIL